MKRRDMLKAASAAVVGLSAFPLGWAAAAEPRKKKVLYFTRCAGFVHSVVERQGDQLSHSEKILVELGKANGFEVECLKDGRLFDGDLDQYDAIAFFTSGNLTTTNKEPTPPMTPAGKQKLLDAIAAGKGFVGIHAASDTFHAKGEVDPYIAMLGGEFHCHGEQQDASMWLCSRGFPGIRELGLGESLALFEEWYAMKNYAKDLHVIAVQETRFMQGDCYRRPPYPASWARMHGRGRVYYTSLGHREDVWTNGFFQNILLGGLAWALGNVNADIKPNIDAVTPHASRLTEQAPS